MSNQQSNTPRLRPILKSIHIWIGLIAGTLISVLSLTGSVIVFQNEIAQATALRRAAAANGSGSAGLDDVARQVTSASGPFASKSGPKISRWRAVSRRARCPSGRRA